MKNELTSRITTERIGKRFIITIKAHQTFATLGLMPIIFIACVYFLAFYLDKAETEIPEWLPFLLVGALILTGILFLRQWLWEYRGKEILYFDALTNQFSYTKEGTFWIVKNRTWPMNTLSDIHIKGRGFLEGNLRLGLPPFCTLTGKAEGKSFRMGDSLPIEDGWRLWMEVRKEGFFKDEQLNSTMIIPELEERLNLKPKK